jgi:predicted dehydrogenase
MIGEVIHVTGYYVKGITHIGCTAVDTIRFLCGEVMWVSALPPFQVGSSGTDPSLRGVLGLKNGTTAIVIGCDLREYVYSLFEIDIVGTHGRVKIEDNGDIIRTYTMKNYNHYVGFKELTLLKEINTQMQWTMKIGLEMILKNISEGRESTFYAEEGLEDLKVIDAIKRSAEQGGRRIEV